MEYIKINGASYPITGYVKMKTGEIVPLVDIPMMSDEDWNKRAEELARENFRKWYGREAETAEEAFEGQRSYIREHFGITVSERPTGIRSQERGE